MTVPPTNSTQYRIEQLETHARELREEMRERSHNLQSAVSATQLLCNSIPDILRRLEALERYEMGVIANDVAHIKTDTAELGKKLDSNNRVMWTIAASLIAAALTLAVAISTGTLG